jgi:hypothetical protein
MAKKRRKLKKVLGAALLGGLGLAAARAKRNKAIDAGIAAADEEPGALIKNYGPYIKRKIVPQNKGNTANMFDYGDAFGYMDVGFKKGGRVTGAAKRGFGRALMKGKK